MNTSIRFKLFLMGSIIFHSSNDLHNIRNAGSTPATYHVIQWRAPAR